MNPIPAEWRQKVYRLIYKTDTISGRLFDIGLVIAILLSVFTVMLHSIQALTQFNTLFIITEWILTIIFTGEYLLRLLCVKEPKKYALSFFGIVDALSILPTYLSFFIPGIQALLVIRILRLLRIFQILHLDIYLQAIDQLIFALKKSWARIFVFLFTVLTLAIVVGALMFFIEGGRSGFSSIPRGIYWAIITITTVGAGDIYPRTDLGQFLASILMILGYGILAVPVGLFGVEIAKSKKPTLCKNCGETIPETAKFCDQCGKKVGKKPIPAHLLD